MKPNKELLIAFAFLTTVYGCSFKDSGKISQKEGIHWANTAVWYSIFPERFKNGDSSNDPVATRVLNGAEIANWELTPWTENWFKPDPWMSTGKTQHLDSETSFRRYGGDLQGVINELDYLYALGITAIWFNPVFDAQSLHKYEASSFHHIDPYFGPNPILDEKLMSQENPSKPETWVWTSADSLFLHLIEEVHKRDMKIIIDGVFNHTGRDFWAFKDILENGESSAFKNWYEIMQFDDPATTENEFDYEGWWGIKALPVLNENEKGLVKEVKNHIYAITKRWMDPDGGGDPSDGVDGWRLDVAEEVAIPFWQKWNTYVHEINPNAYTTAETWSVDAYKYMEEAAFDGVMNYQYAFLANDYFANQDINATVYLRKLDSLIASTPIKHRFKVQNLYDSHDTPRIVSMLESPVKQYDRGGAPREGFKTEKPTEESYLKLKTMLVHLMCSPGAPLIYYGTEAGMWGADDPHNRKPMLWPGLDYENEKNYAQSAKIDKNSFDYELYNFVQSLILLRDENRALSVGDFELNKMYRADPALLSYLRVSNKNEILVVINPNSSIHSIDVENNWEVLFQENMDGFSYLPDTSIELPSYSALILSKVLD
jgi:glycosidase